MPDFRRYPNEGSHYLVTTNVKNRQHLFAERSCCQIVIDGIRFLRTGLEHRVHAYVIMPNHVHLVVNPRESSNISQVTHSFKLHTAREIGALLESKGGIWQGRFYEQALRTPKDAQEAIQYVHNNPVEAGLADCPEGYDWSSYRACILGEPTPTKIDPLVW